MAKIRTKNEDACKLLVVKLVDLGIDFTCRYCQGGYNTVSCDIMQSSLIDHLNDSVDEAAFDSYESNHLGAA